MINPPIIEEDPTANCCNADLILIKDPRLAVPAAAVIKVLGGINLPLPKMKNTEVTISATNTGTGGKLVKT